MYCEGDNSADTFFLSLESFVTNLKNKFCDDLAQGFIKESEYKKILQDMLQNHNLSRTNAGFGNLSVNNIKIENNKLYIDGLYFKREFDENLSTPYAVFIKNSTQSIRYYNYYIEHGNYKFKRQQSLEDIMEIYNLTREEAEAYSQILKSEYRENY